MTPGCAGAARVLLSSPPVSENFRRPVAFAAICLGWLAASAGASPTPIRWENVPLATRGGGVTAVAVRSDGSVAVGDARGARLVEPDGSVRNLPQRGAVRDLAFFRGDLLVAAERGLFLVDPAGVEVPLTPAPGEAARRITRISVHDELVAIATGDGAFISRDARTWRRISTALPNGPATAIGLETSAQGIVCWIALGGSLWRAEILTRGAEWSPGAVAREPLAAAATFGGPVDIMTSHPSGELIVLFPSALAVRRAPGASWELWRPRLPPGARALRLSHGLGRLWLATNRGLLGAASPREPWQRFAAALGSVSIRALAATDARLYVATDRGLSVGAAAPAPAAAKPLRLSHRFEFEPGIEQVQRAALRHLDLDGARIHELQRGLRRRGWLPIASLRIRRDEETTRRRERDEAFLSGEVRRLIDHDRDRDDTFELQLSFTWDFGDVAYNPESIDLSRETRALIELRDDVLDEINQLYFERRRVMADRAVLGDSDPLAALRLELRAAELAAGIDAWTGGWFASQLGAGPP